MYRHPPWCPCSDCNPPEETCRACGKTAFRDEMVSHDRGRTWSCNLQPCLSKLDWPVCVSCEGYLDPDGARLTGGVLCLDCYDLLGEVGLMEIKAEQAKTKERRAA